MAHENKKIIVNLNPTKSMFFKPNIIRILTIIFQPEENAESKCY